MSIKIGSANRSRCLQNEVQKFVRLRMMAIACQEGDFTECCPVALKTGYISSMVFREQIQAALQGAFEKIYTPVVQVKADSLHPEKGSLKKVSRDSGLNELEWVIGDVSSGLDVSWDMFESLPTRRLSVELRVLSSDSELDEEEIRF